MSERQTFKQINDQESSAYLNRSNDKPTVLVKRSSGNITVGRLNKDTRNVDFSEDGQIWTKRITLENLSDARQEELAEELAGRALRGTVELEQTSEEPTESVVEFDENGLIKMPAWMNAEQQPSVNESSSAPAPELAPETDPFDELDESVQAEVLLYRRVVKNKAESEAAKNFSLAASDGRQIYEVRKKLSPAAKAFLNISY